MYGSSLNIIHEDCDMNKVLLKLCQIGELQNRYNRVFLYVAFQKILHFKFTLVNQLLY
jgi:hypothetical protein